ncbi:hypothetical protein F3J34_08495 [Klebsiella sp. Ap-873]|uniref:Uncharacterized protein n=1 Tax=Cedecea neteri TaxID=158822 RepID=A0AAN0S607_9ENTR|nr:hypothetical protein [Cedecea neteri]AIR62133.1 hypothetical protein LH23_16175 [Cedecea neteri]NIG73635.1 hypothetical protein [Klebsiella sp. Ap-873]
MNEQLIAFEAMLAAKDSAQWAWWTMAASIATVLISLATLGMAFTALNTWRDEEELKLKMEFKRAVLELIYALESMPEIWWYHQISIARTRLNAYPEIANRIDDDAQIYFKKQALKEAFDDATKAWLMCEHLFSDSQTDSDWTKFNDEFRPYIMRGGNKQLLSNILDSLSFKLKML